MSVAGRTYGKLALRDGQWWVGHLEPHVAMRFKALFPKVPKASPGPFMIGRDSATAADLAWFASRYPLAAPAEVLALLGLGLGAVLVPALRRRRSLKS